MIGVSLRVTHRCGGGVFAGSSRRALWSFRKANSASGAGSGAGAGRSQTSFLPWYLRRGLRVIQIGVISYSIYSLGYQLGVMDAVQFPLETEQRMIEAALPLVTATDEELQRFQSIHHSREYHRVTRVLDRVILSARDVLQSRLRFLSDAQGNSTDDDELRIRLEMGLQKLSGQWQLVLFPSREVNAFVTGLCPRKVFLFTGLLSEVLPTDDELALVLAHELSHIILGHNEGKGGSSAFLLSLQLVMLSLVDPIGLSALVYDYLTNLVRNILDAGFSRATEMEADVLGLEITANACFDIRKGVNVMQKLAMVSQRIPIDVTHHAHGSVYKHAPSVTNSDANGNANAKNATATSVSATVSGSGAVDRLSENPIDVVQNEIETVVEIINSSPKLPKRTTTSWLDTHPSSTERYELLVSLANDMVIEFRKMYDERTAGRWTSYSSVVNDSGHIDKPYHCYGVWADMERCGIPFTKWLW